MIMAIVAGSIILLVIIIVAVILLTKGGGYAKAKKLYEQRKYSQAHTIFTKLHQRNLTNVDYQWYLGRICEHQNQTDKAMMYYDSIINSKQLSDEFSKFDVRKRLVDAYLKKNNVGAAELVIQDMVKERPGDPVGYLKMGQLALIKNEQDRAIGSFKKAVALDPNNKETLNTLGKCYYDVGKKKEALDAYQKFVAAAGSADAKTYFVMGECAQEVGDRSSAIKYYAQAAKSQEFKGDGLIEVGLLLSDAKNFAKAVPILEKAIKHPIKGTRKKLKGMYIVANYKSKTGDLNTACKLWEDIYNIDPGFEDVETKISTFKNVKSDNTITNMLSLSPMQFKDLIVKVLDKMGYEVIKEFDITSDGVMRFLTKYYEKGQDSYEVLVETGKWTNPVGELRVRELVGLIKEYRTHKGIYITPSIFTDGALKAAEVYPLDLIDNTRLSQMVRNVQ